MMKLSLSIKCRFPIIENRKIGGIGLNWLKYHYLELLCLSMCMLIFEVLGHRLAVMWVALGLFLLLLYAFLNIRILRFVALCLAVSSLILASLLTQSIWVVVLMFVIGWHLFKSPSGNELISFGESILHPFFKRGEYRGIQLVQPQSKQRSLLKRQSLTEALTEHSQQYEWDDVNIVYFGGNSIIDCGNSLLPERETTIMIRKVFGQTRLILPKDIGLKLNISMLSGNVVFENQRYPLVAENFQWRTQGYMDTPRRMNIVISVTFGTVEVILL